MIKLSSILKGPALYQRAKKLIPGGTNLLSKRPEMYLPEKWPSYFKSAKGVEVVDLDGNTFIDMCTMGIGACILGYADNDVNSAVKKAIDAGIATTLNVPEDIELGELLCKLHPWAKMVRYSRSGGEAMAIAVRIARSYSKKDVVVFCGYHGWTDWYLAANLSEEDTLDGHLLPGLEPSGVPRKLQGTALAFRYNKLDELKRIVAEYGAEIGTIVMEPQRGTYPEKGFLISVREIANSIDAVLIFDEISTGFRMVAGGIHLLHNVDPDIAVFAKAIANGYAMSAIIGKEEVMQAAQSTFISSTNWTERIGTVAAISTINKYIEKDVAEHIIRIGQRVKLGWKETSVAAELNISVSGLPTICSFSFNYELKFELVALFVQLMLEKGYLAFTQFRPSFAHTEKIVDKYIDAVGKSFIEIKTAIDNDDVSNLLVSSAAHSGFSRLN